MKFLFAVLVISVIVLLGSRLTYYRPRLPLGFRTIFLTGMEYIFIGSILGRMGFNILDGPTLEQLEPALHFVLCWIGLLFGLLFEIRYLKLLPQYYFSITAIQTFFTFLLVTVSLFLYLPFVVTGEWPLHLGIACALGSIASCTAQSSLAVVAQTGTIKNKSLMELLRYISGVDGLFAMLFFSITLCFSYSLEKSGPFVLNCLFWLLASCILGIFPAFLLILLSRTRYLQQEFILFTFGTVMFSAGLANTLELSPLISGVICGITLANFSGIRQRALSMIIHGEKTIYIFLLLLIGAHWSISWDFGLLLIVLFFNVRLFGKLLGSYAAIRVYQPQYRVPWFWGIGLLPQGGLSMAMIVSFVLVHDMLLSQSLLTVIIFSVFVSELIGPACILQTVKTDPEDIVSRGETG